jgi:hypothetical protein
VKGAITVLSVQEMMMIHLFPMPVLACGMCADTQITGVMPFLVYWLFILLAWSLVAGPICLRIARRAGELQARNPLLLFLILILAWVIGCPCTMGAVVVPAFFVLVFWLFSIRDNLRKPNRVWRRAHQILAIVLLSCIPISYILPKPFAEYRKKMNRPSQYYYQESLENENLKGEGTGGTKKF